MRRARCAVQDTVQMAKQCTAQKKVKEQSAHATSVPLHRASGCQLRYRTQAAGGVDHLAIVKYMQH